MPKHVSTSYVERSNLTIPGNTGSIEWPAFFRGDAVHWVDIKRCASAAGNGLDRAIEQ